MKLKLMHEDWHGGAASFNGNYSTTALERSQSSKGPYDRYNAPIKKKKKKKKKKSG